MFFNILATNVICYIFLVYVFWVKRLALSLFIWHWFSRYSFYKPARPLAYATTIGASLGEGFLMLASPFRLGAVEAIKTYKVLVNLIGFTK